MAAVTFMWQLIHGAGNRTACTEYSDYTAHIYACIGMGQAAHA